MDELHTVIARIGQKKIFIGVMKPAFAMTVTMSICITLLAAFGNPKFTQNAKISIIVSSLLAGTAGFLILNTQIARISNHSV